MATLLGPAEIRELADRLGVSPTKTLGQNFVHDPNTVRRIVRAAGLAADDVVLEVGPGLGSLTLALLPEAAHVHAVEIDPRLAGQLAATVAEHAPALAGRLTVHPATPCGWPRPTSTRRRPRWWPTCPTTWRCRWCCTCWPSCPGCGTAWCWCSGRSPTGSPPRPGQGLRRAEREAGLVRAGAPGRTGPGQRVLAGAQVESGLVAFTRRDAAGGTRPGRAMFAVVDAAFGQRRKMLRSALAGWAGGAEAAVRILERAGVAPTARGEQLDVAAFAAIAAAAHEVGRAG